MQGCARGGGAAGRTGRSRLTSPPETRARAIARWLLILFYGLAGVAHLIVTDAMLRIVPGWVPFPRAIVILTGVAELAGAIGLMTARWRIAAGWGLAAYALCVWPANIKHLVDDLGSGTGLPIGYHGPRMIAQPLIIWWALWASGAIRVCLKTR